MASLDVVVRRMWRAIRDALPGPTTASRLMRQPGHWRQAPPQQRAAAYAQHLQTQQVLHQHHIGVKILPKLIQLLFIGFKHHLAAPLGQLILIAILAALFGLW
jgi:N-dimethylarginine dimethylaminohydrolase